MDHKRLRACARAFVPREMRNFSGYNGGLARFDDRHPLVLDLDREISLLDVENFLSTGVHVPRRSDTRSKFCNADYAFLNCLILADKILAHDRADLRSGRRRLRLCNPGKTADRESGPRKV